MGTGSAIFRVQKKRVLHTLRDFTFHILKLIENYLNLGALILTCYSQLKQSHLLTKPRLQICQACIGTELHFQRQNMNVALYFF